jgi:long-chain acyl-CoA synthetase
MGYGTPHTLSNVSMRNCKGDIAEFHPSILIGVPAVWETIRKGIESRVEKEGFVKRNVFWGAFGLKRWLLTWGFPGAGILDSVVFDTVRKETGGRLRACFNGAGPIGRDTRIFVSSVIAPLINGYGMTETTA